MARSAGLSQTAYNALIEAYKKHGTINDAAKECGIHPRSAREYIRGNYKPAPDTNPDAGLIIENLRKELQTTRDALTAAKRPRYTVRSDNIARGEKIVVTVIGDAHDSPHIPDKSRFKWLGKHVKETKPDFVIQIGDIATFDSVSTHTSNHTIEGKSKPKIIDDINSLNLALDAFNSGLGSYSVPKHITLGNHERRVFAFENENPEIDGMASHLLDQCLTTRGWTYSPYGDPYFIGGVAFLHCAINRMGKAFGGKTAENQIANESITDCVIGHSHIKRVTKHSKLHHRHVTIANAGCALPNEYIEDYAKHAQTGWSYGVMTLVIHNKHITDDQWVSMATLEKRYG